MRSFRSTRPASILAPILAILASTVLVAAPANATSAADQQSLPGFDRPGLLFATDTTPQDRFILEQGLPDFILHDEGNTDITYFALNSLLRYGIASDWELQLGMAPFASLDIDSPGGEFSETGYTDMRIGAKRNLNDELGKSLGGADVAFLGGITLSTGDDFFTADDEIFDLGLTANWGLQQSEGTVGALVQLTSGGVQDNLLIAGAYSAPLARHSSYYVEAGITSGDTDGSVIGGGVAWNPMKDMQLDVYLRAGASGDAPDLQGGFGISIYFR